MEHCSTTFCPAIAVMFAFGINGSNDGSLAATTQGRVAAIEQAQRYDSYFFIVYLSMFLYWLDQAHLTLCQQHDPLLSIDIQTLWNQHKL